MAKKGKKKKYKQTGENEVPLSLLEERLEKLNNKVKRRGGTAFPGSLK